MMTEDDLVVTNIGTVQHEWRVARPSRANLYGLNMGQCTAVALGLSLALPKRRVFALDGDGSLLLNLVALGDVAYHKPENLRIIVFGSGDQRTGGKCLVVKMPERARMWQKSKRRSRMRVSTRLRRSC